jgi:hypothetical protein
MAELMVFLDRTGRGSISNVEMYTLHNGVVVSHPRDAHFSVGLEQTSWCYFSAVQRAGRCHGAFQQSAHRRGEEYGGMSRVILLRSFAYIRAETSANIGFRPPAIFGYHHMMRTVIVYTSFLGAHMLLALYDMAFVLLPLYVALASDYVIRVKLMNLAQDDVYVLPASFVNPGRELRVRLTSAHSQGP